MAEVDLENIAKRYANGVLAVCDLNVQIAQGELVVLVGPSGCGKTTTLRLIAGLEEATRGTIRIGGRVVDNLPPRSRDAAMVFQRPALHPHLNVRDNLAFGLRLREQGWLPSREKRQRIAQRVQEVAAGLGLADVLDRPSSQLSGGQQQRVALGRALVREPAVFLLDEPLSNLDAPLRAEMRRELHLLQRRLRATMIHVTHDQGEAMTLGDRVVVLCQGAVQQVDRPLALYERPCNRFVAGFIGSPSMNFVEGRLVRRNGDLCFTAREVFLPVPQARLVALTGERAVVLGIRPEDMRIVGSEEDRGPSLEMEVTLAEPLGGSTLVVLERTGWQLTAQTDPRTTIMIGQKLRVRLDMQRSHFFDASTELALGHGCPAG